MVVLVVVAWPWANKQTADLRDRFQQRSELQRVVPGQFQINATGSRVFFIDKETTQGTTGRNVFVSSIEPGGESTVSAQAATTATVDKRQVLVLQKGQRLEASHDLQNIKVSEFDEYIAVIDEKRLALPTDGAMKTRSTLELVRNPSLPAHGELAWRAGLVLCAFNLLLVGMAVATGNPRAGRSGNIAFATFAFLFYFNMLNLGETWVGRGTIGVWTWMLAMHGSVFVLALLWLLKRHENISFRAWFKQRLNRPADSPATPHATERGLA
jgi:lipopolysaccharide export system permease protein